MSNIKLKIKGTKKRDNIEWRNGRGYSLDINAGSGNDIINFKANKQNSKLYGEAGNDTIFGGKGRDYISGGKGNDKLYGNNGNDTILSGKGNDTIKGGKGNDVIYGGKGDDIITGGKGDDIIYTGSGNNTIIINKGDGNDTIYHQGSKTTIDLEAISRFSDIPFGYNSYISFSKNLDDLEMAYTNTDGSKGAITFKNYFKNGNIVSEEIYFKTLPVQVVPMYGIPIIEPPVEYELQEVMEGYFERLKYAPPPFLGGDDTSEPTDTLDDSVSNVNSTIAIVPKYATPLIFSETEIQYPEQVLKYAPPPIYGYTSDRIKLSTMVSNYGLSITTAKDNKYKGTDFDDSITGSNHSDTIFAGKGNDVIYSKKGNDVINAGKGINIIYFSKNDGKKTILNGKGTDIIIIEDEKFSNLKAKFSGKDAVIEYTGGEIILKDYKKGGHSVQYIEAGDKRRKIDNILPSYKSVKSVKNSVPNDTTIENVKSETNGWLANNNGDASNIINADKDNTENINLLIASNYLDKLNA